ncbi:MAG: caspase family protein [Bacteroidota bacterium]
MKHDIELPFAKSHAFIIGINKYENISPLSTAVNDAKGIAKRLRNDHGYHVHAPLLNATKADIVKWMEKDVPNSIGPDDRVVFYFAGHGIALDSEEGPNGYIVPADADPSSVDSLISMADFHKMVDGLKCKHGLLILDCCFAGAFKWSSGFRDVMFDLPSVIYEERFWRFVKDPAWQVITSSAYDQKAADVVSERILGKREVKEQKNHSPFALALYDALDGKGDVIPGGEESDGVITATELYMYLRDRVEDGSVEANKRQTPSFFTLSKHDKGEFIFFHPNHRLNLPPAPDRNPFMGLSSYNENDASLFFGRDRVIEALENMIPGHPLVVVSGASGTGKSSVIKAGLLPNLRRKGWQVLPVIRPGKEPRKNLDEQLPEFDKLLKDNPKSVLVIDQYEELITQCLDPNDGKAFEQQIVDWIGQYPDLRVILSIRSDFEPQFESSLLNKWWDKGRYIVPAFTLEEYREVIVKPASQEVLFYEPDELVDRLVEEVSQAPGALPLLSFTLSELYQAYLNSGRTDRALIEADYETLGGVIGALRTRADATYQDLDKASKNSMRKLMLRMTSMEGGDLAGKRVYGEELEFSSKAETGRIKTVSDKLVDARLIFSGKDNNDKTYVEPAHDALVRSWARLWEWIKATGEEKLSLQNKLGIAVNDYHELVSSAPKKARNLLWNNNPRLSLLKAELQTKDHGLNAREEEFVVASVKRRKVARRNLILITLAVMFGLIGLTIYSFIQRGIAERESITARAQSLLAQSRYLEDRNPTQAFRHAEAGFNLAMENELYPGDFANQLTKTANEPNMRFEMVDTAGIRVDEIQQTTEIANHTFRYDYDRSVVMEFDPSGELVHEYKKLISSYEVDQVSEAVSKVHIPKNGNYIVVQSNAFFHGNAIIRFQLFRHKGDSLSGTGYSYSMSNVNSPEADFYPYPGFLFDNSGRVIQYGMEQFMLFGTSDSDQPTSPELGGFGPMTTAVSFSPSGKFFAVGSEEGSLQLYDATSKKEISGDNSRLLSEFVAHFNEEITEIAFCNNETVLKTVANGKTKYWKLDPLNPWLVNADTEDKLWDPISEDTIRIPGAVYGPLNAEFQSDSLPWRNYKLTYEALYTGENDELFRIGLPSPRESVNGIALGFIFFSENGRYAAVEDRVYPIDPHLILDRINNAKVAGELPPMIEELRITKANPKEEMVELKGETITPGEETTPITPTTEEEDDNLPVIVH